MCLIKLLCGSSQLILMVQHPVSALSCVLISCGHLLKFLLRHNCRYEFTCSASHDGSVFCIFYLYVGNVLSGLVGIFKIVCVPALNVSECWILYDHEILFSVGQCFERRIVLSETNIGLPWFMHLWNNKVAGCLE